MPVTENSPTISEEGDQFGEVKDIRDPDSLSSNDQGSIFSSDDEQDSEEGEDV